MTTVSKAEAARRWGVDPTVVQRWLKRGMPTVTRFGKELIDITVADMWRAANVRHRIRNMPVEPEQADLAGHTLDNDSGEEPDPDDDAPEGDPEQQSYVQARRVREIYNSKIAKVTYEERIGTLTVSADVKDAAFKAARTVRDRLLAIPRRLAPLLTAETDERTIEEMLREEITQALSSLVVEPDA